MVNKYLTSVIHEMRGDGSETGQMGKLHVFIRKRSISVYLHDSKHSALQSTNHTCSSRQESEELRN